MLTEAPAHDQRPEVFEDNRTLSGPLPNVSVGSIIQEEITIKDTAPFFESGSTNRIYFGRRIPVFHTLLDLEAPESIPLKYNTKLLPQVSVKKETVGGVVHVTFEQSELDPIEDAEPNTPDDVPTWPYVEYSTATSWNAIASTYAKLIEPRIQTADVQSLVTSAVGANREQTIRKLISLLHNRVRYTGVEFGEAGLIPRTAAQTLAQQYGDCKDKALTLLAMLRAAKIPANLALLSTRSSDNINPALPGMGSFNHAIVYIPGTPAIWIDATAELYASLDLPWDDQGRPALIVTPDTKELVQTPIGKPDDDKLVETREFFLAENGPGRIVETSSTVGDIDAYYRDRFGGTDSKELRKELEKYVIDAYSAEALTKWTHSSGADLAKPFDLKLEMAKAKRGSSSLVDAAVAIHPWSLFARLPAFLRQDEEEQPKGDKEAAAKKERKNDAQWEPFVTEWHYKIFPPPGFQVRALPPDTIQDVGPTKSSRTFKQNPDGTIESVWRFDTVKPRFTAEEVRTMRQALLLLRDSDWTMITFEQKAYALLTAGKVKESIGTYEALATLHPKEALHRVQIARAMLQVGLGEEARVQAEKAVALEPNSALAQNTLGWILQHDLIGRRFEKGFDLAGSVAAYRKAKKLDPTDTEVREDLAILLEHDAEGTRYSANAKLNDAIAEYLELKTVDKKEAARFDDNVLYDYFYAGRYSDLLKTAEALSESTARNAMRIASVAASQNSTAAADYSKRLNSSGTARAQALAEAGNLLMRVRRYAAAADMLEVAVAGKDDAANLQARIRLIRRTHPYPDGLLPEADPRRSIEDFFVYVLHPADQDKLFTMVEVDSPDIKKQKKEMSKVGVQLHATAKQSGLPAEVLLDTIISNMQFGVDGNEKQGYRIRLQGMGAGVQTFYVVRRTNGWKILGVGGDAGMIGKEVLARIDANDLDSAQQWLNWARESITLNGGDDPIGGPAFPRFWNRGDEASPDRMKAAALSLLAETGFAGDYVLQLLDLCAKAASESEQLRLDIALGHAYTKAEDWKNLTEISDRLFAAYPTSASAFTMVVASAYGNHEFSRWQSAAETRAKHLPDDMIALRSLSRLAVAQNDFTKSRTILRTAIDQGRSDNSDLNSYTWESLFTGNVTDSDLELVQRGTSGQGPKDSNILHTLACIYAEVGKGKEARDALLLAITAGGLDEPDSSIWYGFGRIAELYGLNNVATTIYGRVEKSEKSEYPDSTYQLSRLRLKLMAAQTPQGGASKK